MTSRLEPNLNLHTVLKNSYKDPKKSKKSMRESGYYLDKQLSNHNQQVYYKPNEKKLLVSVAGTHNLSDWGTDLALATGNLKNTSRYKEADSILKKAKQKYNPSNTTVAGHSLGGSIASYIASKAGRDKAITLDAGYTIGQRTRSNTQALRSAGDAVSLLGANAKHTKTINNGNIISNHKYAIAGSLFGPIGTGIGALADAFKAHDVDNIKNNKILI
jgi:hypothetical protein